MASHEDLEELTTATAELTINEPTAHPLVVQLQALREEVRNYICLHCRPRGSFLRLWALSPRLPRSRIRWLVNLWA